MVFSPCYESAGKGGLCEVEFCVGMDVDLLV